MTDISHKGLEPAVFAGGCFWCVEADFAKRPALKDIESGYTGGETDDPAYANAGAEGHREAVRVWYDPSDTSYRELVAYFFTIHDPTDAGGSFHDRGHTYTSAIYYATDAQKEVAEEVIETLVKANVFEKEITTQVEPLDTFWSAEEYHQNYADKNVGHYKLYRSASGRDDFKSEHKEEVFEALDL
jgi:peptide methionine sulfoxide reductase msrA/msrB